MSDPNAFIRMVDGQLVLDDPTACGVIAAVEAHNRNVAQQNCRTLYEQNLDRVSHFMGRMKTRGDNPQEVVIVLLNVDDPNGKLLADILMPGQDWQQYRDAGLLPCARGLASREGLQRALTLIDTRAADTLRACNGVAVIVVDSGTAAVFSP